MAIKTKKALALAERARSARAAVKLTRPQAKSLAGIPYTTLANIENASIERSAQLPRLAAVYGVNPLWLETGLGKRTAAGGRVPLVEREIPDERESRLLVLFRTSPESIKAVILEQAESLARLSRAALK